MEGHPQANAPQSAVELGAAAVEGRVREVVAQYTGQGAHRTGTEADRQGAAWLAEQMEKASAGVAKVRMSSFQTRRLTPLSGSITVRAADGAAWSAEGVPAYDCAEYTDSAGVTGTLGLPGDDCDIALVQYASCNDAADTPGFMEARTSSRHLAVVAAYSPKAAAGVEGLALINAQHFPQGGVGRPVLQVHSRHLQELLEAASAHSQVTLVASMAEDMVDVMNVEAEVQGSDASLAPVLVVTPRSGWWGCAVERATSLAGFLELLRVVAACSPRRSALFTANTGHELGHTGSRHFHHSRPNYARCAHLCMHLGADWGSVRVGDAGPAVLLQVSDEQVEAGVLQAFASQGLEKRVLVAQKGARPVGEARELFDMGARYFSVIGLGHKEFHMEEDLESCADFALVVQLTEVAKQMVLQAVLGQGASAL